jgi:mono/diheme cytochrome c family protein
MGAWILNQKKNTMNRTLLNIAKAGAAIFVAVLLYFLFASPRATADDKAGTAVTTGTATESQVSQTKGGAQLWSENCARCHNIRSPSAYSDAEWEVVMLHMRIRANLTAEQHKAILEFLKSAN